MRSKRANRILPDTYFLLVKAFPLTPINGESQLLEAQEVLNNLLQQELDEEEKAYLDALTDLVWVYEEKHMQLPDPKPEDVLRELIAGSGLSQQALAKTIGIAQSSISAVLNRSRKLSVDQMVKLAKYFNLSPAVFMPR